MATITKKRIPFYQKENLDVFFSDFAEDCYLNDHQDKIIPCLYDERYQNFGGFDSNVNGVNITISLKNSDIKLYSLSKKSNITIREKAFFIREVRFDSDGISQCELEEIKG